MLPQCLASIAAQDHPSWECIVVDDGSTDDTRAVVEAIARRDPRFRYFAQPNAGPSVARNAGIDAARGSWLAFMDSDDEYLPGAFAAFERAIAHAPDVRIACGGLDGPRRVDSIASMTGRIEIRDAFTEMLGFTIAGPRVQLNAAIVHRAVIDDVGRFAIAQRSSEDREWLVRVTARYPVAIVRTFVVRYREGHDDARSQRTLADGSKLAALRGMLANLVDDPAIAPRITPAILRLRDAHLAMLDAAAALRADDREAGARHLAAANARCSAEERAAMLVRLTYLLTFPASRPREAAERAARWLDAIGEHGASIGIRAWAALILARTGAYREAIALAATTIRDAGPRRIATTVITAIAAARTRTGSSRSSRRRRRGT